MVLFNLLIIGLIMTLVIGWPFGYPDWMWSDDDD